MRSSISLSKYTSKYFERYLADDEITEICYNGEDKIFTQNYLGQWSEHDTEFNFDAAQAFAAAAAFKGDQVGEARPILSCVLVTGERVQIVAPLATKKEHISITIRKPSKKRFFMEDYRKSGLFDNAKSYSNEQILSVADKELLELYTNSDFENLITKGVEYGKNIIICGETGSGKTTFMKSLLDFIPSDERLISIEDVEEIVFYKHKNFVQLFYPSEAKSDDFLSSQSLLKSCLRMKPDRILLAELRGGETYDFVNILTSGHKGSISSCHAGGCDDCFTRLALMILQNEEGRKVPFDIIKQTLKSVIDIIVHISAHGGKRRINEVYLKLTKGVV